MGSSNDCNNSIVNWRDPQDDGHESQILVGLSQPNVCQPYFDTVSDNNAMEENAVVDMESQIVDGLSQQGENTNSGRQRHEKNTLHAFDMSRQKSHTYNPIRNDACRASNSNELVQCEQMYYDSNTLKNAHAHCTFRAQLAVQESVSYVKNSTPFSSEHSLRRCTSGSQTPVFSLPNFQLALHGSYSESCNEEDRKNFSESISVFSNPDMILPLSMPPLEEGTQTQTQSLASAPELSSVVDRSNIICKCSKYFETNMFDDNVQHQGKSRADCHHCSTEAHANYSYLPSTPRQLSNKTGSAETGSPILIDDTANATNSLNSFASQRNRKQSCSLRRLIRDLDFPIELTEFDSPIINGTKSTPSNPALAFIGEHRTPLKSIINVDHQKCRSDRLQNPQGYSTDKTTHVIADPISKKFHTTPAVSNESDLQFSSNHEHCSGTSIRALTEDYISVSTQRYLATQHRACAKKRRLTLNDMLNL